MPAPTTSIMIAPRVDPTVEPIISPGLGPVDILLREETDVTDDTTEIVGDEEPVFEVLNVLEIEAFLDTADVDAKDGNMVVVGGRSASVAVGSEATIPPDPVTVIGTTSTPPALQVGSPTSLTNIDCADGSKRAVSEPGGTATEKAGLTIIGVPTMTEQALPVSMVEVIEYAVNTKYVVIAVAMIPEASNENTEAAAEPVGNETMSKPATTKQSPQ